MQGGADHARDVLLDDDQLRGALLGSLGLEGNGIGSGDEEALRQAIDHDRIVEDAVYVVGGDVDDAALQAEDDAVGGGQSLLSDFQALFQSLDTLVLVLLVLFRHVTLLGS
ncbi:hypothetical protein D3C81_1969110 [compost metagenome]